MWGVLGEVGLTLGRIIDIKSRLLVFEADDWIVSALLPEIYALGLVRITGSCFFSSLIISGDDIVLGFLSWFL